METRTALAGHRAEMLCGGSFGCVADLDAQVADDGDEQVLQRQAKGAARAGRVLPVLRPGGS